MRKFALNSNYNHHIFIISRLSKCPVFQTFHAELAVIFTISFTMSLYFSLNWTANSSEMIEKRVNGIIANLEFWN